MKKNVTTAKRWKAGLAASDTKGALERAQAAFMAAWTRKYGKNDAKNPYSKQNYSEPA